MSEWQAKILFIYNVPVILNLNAQKVSKIITKIWGFQMKYMYIVHVHPNFSQWTCKNTLLSMIFVTWTQSTKFFWFLFQVVLSDYILRQQAYTSLRHVFECCYRLLNFLPRLQLLQFIWHPRDCNALCRLGHVENMYKVVSTT